MTVNLISMLTQNDKTVSNALEVFEKSKFIPGAICWGFKDIGIEKIDAEELARSMKLAGKITFYESLVEKEDKCIEAAKFALDNKFDYLMGMPFFHSVQKFLRKTSIKYFPTCGRRSGVPRMLHGTIEDINNDGLKIQENGIDGICLSMYRFTGGDPEELAERFMKVINIPVIISGTIDSYSRLNTVKKLKPWGFTVGSAFFNKKFGEEKNSSFTEQINKVLDCLDQ